MALSPTVACGCDVFNGKNGIDFVTRMLCGCSQLCSKYDSICFLVRFQSVIPILTQTSTFYPFCPVFHVILMFWEIVYADYCCGGGGADLICRQQRVLLLRGIIRISFSACVVADLISKHGVTRSVNDFLTHELSRTRFTTVIRIVVYYRDNCTTTSVFFCVF